MRFLGESLGATVAWDGIKKQAKLVFNGTEVIIIVNSKIAYVNGRLTNLDVPAEIKAGRTFIPMRFVSEALGAEVNYESNYKEITVTFVDKTHWKFYTSSSEEKYMYPPDWTVRENERGVITFKSPKGSYIWEGTDHLTVQESIQEAKKIWQDSGYKLLDQLNIDDNDLNAGSILIFSSPTDDETDYIYVIRQKGTDESWVINKTVVNEFFEIDDPILMEIISAG